MTVLNKFASSLFFNYFSSNSIFDRIIQDHQKIVLDGALGTLLEEKGIELPINTWSSGCILTHPDKIIECHYEYYHAGSDICITASYQCSRIGFPDNYESTLRKSVDLCRIARDKYLKENQLPYQPLIAASIGPFGAILADGSEFSGKYIDTIKEEELKKFFSEKIQILDLENPDLFAFETFPSFKEAKIAISCLIKNSNRPAWITFTCKNENQTCYGDSFEECVKYFDKISQVIGIGINCTSPIYSLELIKKTKRVTSKKVICYPNSGELFVERVWIKNHQVNLEEILEKLIKECDMIGGCCRTSPKTIQFLRSIIKN